MSQTDTTKLFERITKNYDKYNNKFKGLSDIRRIKIIEDLAMDLQALKDIAIAENRGEELAPRHDTFVDNLNNLHDAKYDADSQSGRMERVFIPKFYKAEESGKNTITVLDRRKSRGDPDVEVRVVGEDNFLDSGKKNRLRGRALPPPPAVAEAKDELPVVRVEEEEEVKEEGELKDSKDDEIEVKDVDEEEIDRAESKEELDDGNYEDIQEEQPKALLREDKKEEELPKEREILEEIKKMGDYDEEDIKEIKKIVKDEMGTHRMPDGTEMTGKTHNDFSVPVYEKIQDVPRSNIMIPPELLGVEGKSARQLSKEIKFLLKKYPKMLKQEGRRYKKADKKNLRQMKDIHSRIIGILKPEVDEGKKGKKVGIILDADQYINDKINEILASKTIAQLRPADLVDITSEPKKKGREVGSYAIIKDRSGKPAVERQPVYRAIPSTIDMKPKTRKVRIRESIILKNTGKRPVDIARMEISNNPFAKQSKTPNRLDIIL